MKHFVGVCLFFLALSIAALVFGFVRVKIKVCFWLKDCKQFKVALVWKPEKEEKVSQKPGVDVKAAKKPYKAE